VKHLAFALLALVPPALAQDHDREARWAAEVRGNLVVGDAVTLKAGGRDFLGLYAEAKTPKGTVVLVHGMGVHPDHGVIGALRVWLADAGYSTLAVQMPVLGGDAKADAYPPLFPNGAARIQAAADWLAAKGHARAVLLSHSIGSRMAMAYLAGAANSPFAAWVSLGITSRYGPMERVKLPVLDVYGENDFPAVIEAGPHRLLALPARNSRQVMIAKADHYYTGRERELAKAIVSFLAGIK
jgi:pimeloyl-ACP methyl ester carboxylesterase